MMGFPFSFQATLCFDGKATVVAAPAAASAAPLPSHDAPLIVATTAAAGHCRRRRRAANAYDEVAPGPVDFVPF